MMLRKSTVCFFILSIIMMGIGVFRGESATVLSKGINLCLECVGIG